ncbi:MAG TPA: tripartite tricarboxylate transporter substrate binding protein [Roseomonas sp.]|jgi:tripartite-type tricarboxylate transporter receptor subunit TctC
MHRRSLLGGAASMAALTPMRRVQAADWPSRVISLIMPFNAGGPSDGFARLVAAELNRRLGDPGVVVMNKPGAAGNLGLAEVAAAAPDGYTLGVATNSVAAHVVLTPRPIVTLDSFTWVANLVFEPSVIVVRPGGVTDLRAFVALARGRPVSVAHAGIGTSHQIALTMLERRGGVELVQVPFTGSAPAKTQIIGGHVDAGCFPLSEALTMVRANQGVALGVTTAERSPFAPELPTFREQGFDVVSGTRRGIVAPAGLPPAIRDRLTGALAQVMQSREIRTLLDNAQIQIEWMTGDALLAAMRENLAQLRELGLTAAR